MSDKIQDAELESFGYKQELERTLSVTQLTAFGINYMVPLSPAIIFGFIAAASGTSVALPFTFAFIAMLFTANSYVFMIKKYPIAGSLYSYVSKTLSPYIGFLSGWVLILDYVLIPTVTAVSAVLFFKNFFPDIPFIIIFIPYILLTGFINIVGVKIIAKMGLFLLIIGELTLILSFVVWGHSAIAHSGEGIAGLFSTQPFAFDNLPALFGATSVAVLTYLGFDAITTLAEEAKNPKKDIPIAIFLSICIGFSTMFLCGYLGVLAFPDIASHLHDDVWKNSALFFISKSAGGNFFAEIFTASFILSMFVFNVVATTAGSRLLFGMGRDGILPKHIFGKIGKKFKTPHYNIMLIMLIEFAVGMTLSVDMIAQMVNFGALLGFTILNFCVMYHTFKNGLDKSSNKFKAVLVQIVFPLLGMSVLLVILLYMDVSSLIVGCSWLLIGIIYSKYHKIKK